MQRALGIRSRAAVLGALAILLLPAADTPARAEEDFETSAEIAAPVDVAWRVLVDFRAWPSFVPGLKRIAVEERSDRRLALRHETERVGVALGFTAVTSLEPEHHRLALALDESAANDLAAMRASWELTPLPSGGVRVVLRSAIESGRPVPGFIERRMLRDQLLETLARFGAEVERRAGERQAAQRAEVAPEA
jgi:ribosome-associated toxin RatA of RatAB toxin-antitoxin module